MKTRKPTLKQDLIAVALLPLTFFASPVLACSQGDVRFASSTNRIYIESPVTCTLNDLKQVAPDYALELVDSSLGIWLLQSELHIKAGGTLEISSPDHGGTVSELRLKSSPGLDGFVKIRVDYGNLSINGSLITSWDPQTRTPDYDVDDGRAFIMARSFLEEGITPRESDINISNAEIAYLGYKAAESYGLSLKVKAKREEEEIFELVDIFGSITNSEIHHNYMGFYSWGAYGLEIRDNNIHSNISYGIDPHDNSDFLTIDNNYVHDNGNHGIICSQNCDHLTITNNISENNRHGIMLHKEVTDSLVENNVCRNNSEVGIALYSSHNNTIRNNETSGNEDGIRLSAGSYNNQVSDNLVTENTRYGLYLYRGNDDFETTDGRPRFNAFEGNTVENNERPLFVKESDKNNIIGNRFAGNMDFTFRESFENQFNQNEFSGIPTISLKGDSEDLTSTFASINNDIRINLDEFSSALLTNADGRIMTPTQPGSINSVTPLESQLFLITDVSGPSSTITSQPLWIQPLQGEMVISNVDWSDTPQWGIASTIDQQSVNMILGELTPASSYHIKRWGQTIHTAVADAEGKLTVNETMPTAGDYSLYTLESASIGTEEITLVPVADTYVRSGSYGDENYGSKQVLEVKKRSTTGNYHREALLKFNLSDISQADTATLELTASLSTPSELTILVSSVGNHAWDESATTFNSRPITQTVVAQRTITSANNTVIQFDVTGLIQEHINDGNQFVSINVQVTNEINSILRIRSRESNKTPKLILKH